MSGSIVILIKEPCERLTNGVGYILLTVKAKSIDMLIPCQALFKEGVETIEKS